jgi:hypothetical protein
LPTPPLPLISARVRLIRMVLMLHNGMLPPCDDATLAPFLLWWQAFSKRKNDRAEERVG